MDLPSASSSLSYYLFGGSNKLFCPATIADCLDSEGNVDADKHRRLLREEADFVALHQAECAAAFVKCIVEDDDDDCDDRGQPDAKRRRGERGALFYADTDGIRRVLPPFKSLWHNMYIDKPSLDTPQFHVKFRKRFRMPYSSYLELVEKVNNSNLFERWKDKKDAVGNPCAPIPLLLLASLRYLGRAWTFDDLNESTAISEEVIRCFFH